MDIAEIALDYYKDFQTFERLAAEVMRLEGFPSIHTIGGISDDGIDAELVKYYEDDETHSIIFQFTIQETIQSKIDDTIQKLKTNKVKFNQLIIVTKHRVTNIQDLRTKARIKHKVQLDIFDRETLVKHLSDPNGILVRFFPDLKAQLNSILFEHKSIFSAASDTDLETSLLKCSLLFTFSNNDHARRDLYDQTILSLIVSNKNSITKDRLINEVNNRLKKEISEAEIDAIITRLKKEGFINIKTNIISPTKAIIERIEGSVSKVNASTESLFYDILNKVFEITDEKIDIRTERIIIQNIKFSLSAYFRLHGVDYSYLNSESPKSFENEDLIKLAKKGLPEKIGDLVVYSIGEVIKSPTKDQADTLANWAKAFLGFQIMGLDPKLSQFQATKLRKKTFVLDTDFLLYCIVENTSKNIIYLKIIDELLKQGCRVIVPTEIIFEAIKHAEYAHRSYTYFKNTLETVDELIVDEKIANIFVKGYYSAVLKNRLDSSETSFKTYIGNFYNKESAFFFMKEVVSTFLPKSVEIKDISEIGNVSIQPDVLEELTNLIFLETNKSFKSASRTEEENREISRTDALLFLSLYELNRQAIQGKEVLSNDFYLITSSSKAARCARTLQLYNNVFANPKTIVSLLQRIGRFNSTSAEIVNLFDNPYLIEAVNNSWNQIKNLVEAGISLKGKNVVKLRWDLSDQINRYLKAGGNENYEEEKVELEEDNSEEDDIEDYIEFISSVKSKGYTLIPQVEALISRFNKMKLEVQDSKEIQEKLSEELKKYSKRKQNYLSGLNKNKKK